MNAPNSLDNTYIVTAHVLVPLFHRYHFNMEIDGWKVIPTSGGTKYIKIFKRDSLDTDWMNSVTSLRYILLASFLDDFGPRVIKEFNIDHSLFSSEEMFKLIMVFGQNEMFDQNNNEEKEKQMLWEASKLSGTIFNGFYNKDPHYQPNTESIMYWYKIFKNNFGLATNINYVMQSFILFNRYFQNTTFFDPTELLNGIIFLVSALEGIFLKNQNDFADLSFKFSTIGSIYYDKYAKEEFIKRYDDASRKYSIKEFREILKSLYSLRSNIAHGDYEKLNNKKTWKKLLNQKSVAYEESFDIRLVLRHVALALGLFEKHILAIILEAKADLLKGADIINEVKYTY